VRCTGEKRESASSRAVARAKERKAHRRRCPWRGEDRIDAMRDLLREFVTDDLHRALGHGAHLLRQETVPVGRVTQVDREVSALFSTVPCISLCLSSR